MELKGHGRQITSVFQLLGKQENDITKAISFLLSNSKSFLSLFLNHCGIKEDYLDNVFITYQEQQDNGITDIEIYKSGVYHIVIEAKINYNLPSDKQLEKYADNLIKIGEPNNYIFTMSNLRAEIAENDLKKDIKGIPIRHISYSDVLDIAKRCTNKVKREEKVFLRHFISFMKGIIDMQDKRSNTVYVVALDGDSIKEHDEKRQYHCPVGGYYLKEPCNSLGFRYKGKLQYINHVEKVEYYKDGDTLFFRFTLGADIIPSKTVKTGGKYRNTKFYCDIDLLLTCDTIIEANQKSKARHAE